MTINHHRLALVSWALVTLMSLSCGDAHEQAKVEDYSTTTLDRALSEQDFDTTVQQLTQLPYLPWAYTPDGCYARALYYSMLLATKQVGSNHVYIIASSGTVLGGQWRYHATPVVTKDSDSSNLYVLDPVYDKTRALTVVEWAAKMNFPDPMANNYPSFHVNPGHTYSQVNVSGIPLGHPEQPNVATYKEPPFAAMGQFRTVDIQQACLVMHAYIDREPGLGNTDRATKHLLLGSATRSLMNTLSGFDKLSGSASSVTMSCLRTTDDESERFASGSVGKPIAGNLGDPYTRPIAMPDRGHEVGEL